jgi:hypothetical protein
MPTNTTIDIPPATDESAPAGTISFYVSSNCTVCFGTANPAGSFPDLEGHTWNWSANTTYGPYTANTANATLPYNTSGQGNPCDPEGLADIGHTITITSGMATARTTAKPKAKAKPKPKPKVKARVVAKAKPAPKTKAKSKAKPKPKPKAKPKAKAKTKAKAKPKAKKSGKKR